jgi:hypothetical protein
VVIWQFAWHEKDVLLCGLALFLAGLANSLALLVLARLTSTGYEVGYWRWSGKDFEFYRQYWQIAPAKGRSRWVLVGAGLCMVSGLGLFLALWL